MKKGLYVAIVLGFLTIASCTTFKLSGIQDTQSISKPVWGIGDRGPAGGIVFYDKGRYSDGWRWLEAASRDQSMGVRWGGYGTSVGGTSTAIGSGSANTAAIVAAYGVAEPFQSRTDYPAKLCDDYDDGTYSDWFLPSKDELDRMYTKLHVVAVGGFAAAGYWSSSETEFGHAWGQYFANGDQDNHNKGNGFRVRAVRAF
jgi:hypothetical protein